MSGADGREGKPRVLVIGGGYGGLGVATAAREHADVTVLDVNDYFNHKAAALRAGLVPGWETRSVVPFAEITERVTFVQGAPASVDRAMKRVVLEDGRTLDFDHLVIATGSTTDLPSDGLGRTSEDARHALGDYQDRARGIGSAIVVGDGPVGIEMAGELRERSPSMAIDVYSSAATPLESVGSPKFSRRVHRLLERHGVGYHPGQRVETIEEHRIVLADGGERRADLVVRALGVVPNTAWLRGTAPDWLDARGQVRVDAELRVVGEDAVFALGDCSDVAEPKMLKMAMGQATVVAGNIAHAIAGEPLDAHERFSSRLTILPFGSGNGVALLPIGREGLLVWAPLGRFLVRKRKAERLLSNLFPAMYA